MNIYRLMFFVFLLVVSLSQSSFAQNEVNEPKVKQMAFPIYPISAIAAGISGDVIVEVEINKEGNIVDTKLLIGHKLLQGVVQQTLSSWKFLPETKNEKRIFVFTFSIVPQGIPNIITATFEFPNKITIFGAALKDPVGIPVMSNSEKKID